jgi:hypothetical protein
MKVLVRACIGMRVLVMAFLGFVARPLTGWYIQCGRWMLCPVPLCQVVLMMEYTPITQAGLTGLVDIVLVLLLRRSQFSQPYAGT